MHVFVCTQFVNTYVCTDIPLRTQGMHICVHTCVHVQTHMHTNCLPGWSLFPVYTLCCPGQALPLRGMPRLTISSHKWAHPLCLGANPTSFHSPKLRWFSPSSELAYFCLIYSFGPPGRGELNPVLELPKFSHHLCLLVEWPGWYLSADPQGQRLIHHYAPSTVHRPGIH